jgi:DNA repair protein RadB
MHLPTGISALNELLGGGILQGELTMLYGEGGSGKSALMLQLASNSALQGWKTIFVQSRSRFPSERFKQIAGSQWSKVVEQVPIMELHDFQQQEQLTEVLSRYITSSVKLVLWDTLTSLYRTAQGTAKQNVLLNKSLSRQLVLLLELAKAREIAIVVSADMHGVIRARENEESDWNEEGPVAEKVLDYWTAVRLKLQKTPQLNQRRLTMERNPRINTPQSILLQMSAKGLEPSEAQ